MILVIAPAAGAAAFAAALTSVLWLVWFRRRRQSHALSVVGVQSRVDRQAPPATRVSEPKGAADNVTTNLTRSRASSAKHTVNALDVAAAVLDVAGVPTPKGVAGTLSRPRDIVSHRASNDPLCSTWREGTTQQMDTGATAREPSDAASTLLDPEALEITLPDCDVRVAGEDEDEESSPQITGAQNLFPPEWKDPPSPIWM